ncbi:MAG: hypothetical protein K9N55_09695 [Phycisphaerae bacterium]|nr:hypothetical protein [Phycisphaerae bacterium]
MVMTPLALPQSEAQLSRWLRRFPVADTNGDGKLTIEEARAFMASRRGGTDRQGPPTEFRVDPGWSEARFPDHAVCYMTPAEIQALYRKVFPEDLQPVFQVPRPAKALRIVGTGHSFMAPGYGTFPVICQAAGFEQPLRTHTGGGMTGSARFKWEQENGIFEFADKPQPKLLAAIATGQWDAMMWGPYYGDRPEFYVCWIDFCLKYNPNMEFFLSDAWPQLGQLDPSPQSEAELSVEAFIKLGREKHASTEKLIAALDQKYPGKVHIMPTSAALVLAVQAYYEGKLPGIEGINRSLSHKTYSIWQDQLGHLGPGFERLEGYVFYATVYKRSPALIEGDIPFKPVVDKQLGVLNPPNRAVDRLFRRIAWQAVTGNPLSDVTDRNGDGIGD